MSRLLALKVQLKRVSKGIVLVKERLADRFKPFRLAFAFVMTDGFASPKSDVIEVYRVSQRVAIDQRSLLAVADG